MMHFILEAMASDSTQWQHFLLYQDQSCTTKKLIIWDRGVRHKKVNFLNGFFGDFLCSTIDMGQPLPSFFESQSSDFEYHMGALLVLFTR